MGLPVPPRFEIHLGIKRAIEKDMIYWSREFRRQRIMIGSLIGSTIVAITYIAMLLI